MQRRDFLKTLAAGRLLETTAPAAFTRNAPAVVVLNGHTGDVQSLAFSPDGRWLVTGSLDTTARLWDLSGLATTRDEIAEMRELITRLDDDDFAVRRRSSRRLRERGTEAVPLLWAALENSDSAEKRFRLQRLIKNAKVPRLAAVRTFRDSTARVQAVAFSPGGKTVATGTAFGSGVKLWDVCTGQRLPGPETHATAVAFSPDGTRLATAGQSLTLWQIPEADSRRAGVAKQAVLAHGDDFRTLDFSPDGRRLAAAGGRRREPAEITVWDVKSGRKLIRFRAHDDRIEAVRFLPKGKALASTGTDNSVRIWEAATGELRCRFQPHHTAIRSLAISPDGSLLATGGDDERVVLSDPTDRRKLATITGHAEDVLAVAFSPDGTLLATGGRDRTVRLWKTAAVIGRRAGKP